MSACTLFLPTTPYGRITICNPPRNTLSHPVFADGDRLQALLCQPALKGVVVLGDGDHFCSGLAQPASTASERSQALALLDLIRYAPVPVVAAIRGDCLGAGLDIARACHFRIAGRSAHLGYPASSPRLVPNRPSDCATAFSLSRSLPSAPEGAVFCAPEALAAKVVDAVCDDAGVEAEALSLLESLTGRRSAYVVHAAMVSIGNAQRLAPREALVRESLLFRDLAMRSDSTADPEGTT